MAAEPWSQHDNDIFEEYAFSLSDDIPDKWERIAAMLQRPATVGELRQRYQNLFRDLWLIERGDVTRASYMAVRAAEGAAAVGGSAAGGEVAGPAVQQSLGEWSPEEQQVIDHAMANGGIRRGQYDAILQQLPGRSVAQIECFLKAHYPQE